MINEQRTKMKWNGTYDVVVVGIYVCFFHLKSSLSLKYIRTTRSICIIYTEREKKYDSHHTVTLEQW